MSVNPTTIDKLKVRNWNTDSIPESRVDYTLSIFEGGHWIQIGTEIDYQGNTQLVEKYNCEMP